MLSNCLVVVVVVVICFCYFIHFAHFIHASQAGKQVFPKQLFARKVLPAHEYVIYIDKNAHIHNYTHTYAHVKQLIAIQRKFRHRTSTIYHWHDSLLPCYCYAKSMHSSLFLPLFTVYFST